MLLCSTHFARRVGEDDSFLLDFAQNTKLQKQIYMTNLREILDINKKKMYSHIEKQKNKQKSTTKHNTNMRRMRMVGLSVRKEVR